MNRRSAKFCSRDAQAGSSLIVTMIMLVVLMLMGVAGVVMSNTQVRMAGNMQFQMIAQSNAESALSYAEKFLVAEFMNPGFVTPSAATPQLFNVVAGANPAPNSLTTTWGDGNSLQAPGPDGRPDPKLRYRIEMLSLDQYLATAGMGVCTGYGAQASCPMVRVFRVSTRGESARGAAKVVETMFAMPIN